MQKKYTICSCLSLLSIIITISFVPTANSQDLLPVLLIHGYLNDKSVWDDWIVDLRKAGIYAEAVEFRGNDKCGSAEDHGEQLIDIVEGFKTRSESDKINIVGHSKGGLDARVYLANNPSLDDVVNLIMIGTPNAGSPRAVDRDPQEILTANQICSPFPDEAINDLVEGSAATTVGKNVHTKYHTIAGDWKALFDYCIPIPFSCVPVDKDCLESPAMFVYQFEGSIEIDGPDDGIVPVESVESGAFNSLGHTDNCHTKLFSLEEFNRAMTILHP